jgi:hypothetical protein
MVIALKNSSFIHIGNTVIICSTQYIAAYFVSFFWLVATHASKLLGFFFFWEGGSGEEELG